MKVSIGPHTVVHPHPVFVVGSFDKDDRPNLAAVSWGGICCTKPPCVAISLREATLTYHNIMLHKAFTVGIPSVEQVTIADYTGIATGRERDKFKDCGLTAIKSEAVHAPYAEEFPYSLICRVTHDLKIGLHTQFIGEILDIIADEDVLNEKKLPDIEKVKPFLYGSHGGMNYYAIGEKLGRAFSMGKNLQPGLKT